MKHIGFVSSINGFGHTRRMMHLSVNFQKRGFLTTLFATKKQIERLLPEMNLLGTSVNFVEILSYGVDGPVWMKDGCPIEKPSNQVINILKRCDLVISDNCIWPIKFNSNFVLFGHFNWLNYWQIKNNQNFSGKLLDIFAEEISLFDSIKISFQLTDFVLNGVFNPRVNIPIKLMRYDSDVNFPRLSEPNKIWIANGTTKLSKNFKFQNIKKNHLKFSLTETYSLLHESYKPSVVIGRPGLGTIRDCLAAGVLFIPYLKDSDPELISNMASLRKLSLVFDFSFNESTFDEEINNLMEDTDLLESWSLIWSRISQDSPEICEQILKFADL